MVILGFDVQCLKKIEFWCGLQMKTLSPLEDNALSLFTTEDLIFFCFVLIFIGAFMFVLS